MADEVIEAERPWRLIFSALPGAVGVSTLPCGVFASPSPDPIRRMATPLTSRIGVDTCDFWALPCCDSAGDLNGGGMGVRGFCVRSRLAGGLGRLEVGPAASPSSSDLRRFSTPLLRSTVLSFAPDVCLARPSERSFLTSAVFLELSRS